MKGSVSSSQMAQIRIDRGLDEIASGVIDHAQDPALLDDYQVEVLSELSLANGSTMRCAALPRPSLSLPEASVLLGH
jgi:hypothetical protein